MNFIEESLLGYNVIKLGVIPEYNMRLYEVQTEHKVVALLTDGMNHHIVLDDTGKFIAYIRLSKYKFYLLKMDKFRKRFKEIMTK